MEQLCVRMVLEPLPSVVTELFGEFGLNASIIEVDESSISVKSSKRSSLSLRNYCGTKRFR